MNRGRTYDTLSGIQINKSCQYAPSICRKCAHRCIEIHVCSVCRRTPPYAMQDIILCLEIIVSVCVCVREEGIVYIWICSNCTQFTNLGHVAIVLSPAEWMKIDLMYKRSKIIGWVKRSEQWVPLAVRRSQITYKDESGKIVRTWGAPFSFIS